MLKHATSGEVVSSSAVVVTAAHSLHLRAYPDPDQTQLILGNEYEIRAEVEDKLGNTIYPSEVSAGTRRYLVTD